MVLEAKHLSEELSRFGQLRQRYLEREGEADDATILEVLAGVSDLHDAIAAAARSALEDEGTASRLRGRLDEMEARLRRIERRAADKRDVALRAMNEAGLERLQAPGLRLEVRHAPPTLLVSDESLIPDAFRVTPPPRIDYQALREALRGGAHVPGAVLSEPDAYLSVRTG